MFQDQIKMKNAIIRLAIPKVVVVVVVVLAVVTIHDADAGGNCGSSWNRHSGGGWGSSSCSTGYSRNSHPCRMLFGRSLYSRQLGSAGFDFWFVPIPGEIPLRQQQQQNQRRQRRSSSSSGSSRGDNDNNDDVKIDSQRKDNNNGSSSRGGIATFSINDDPETGTIDLELEVPGVLPDSINVELEDSKILRVTGRRTKLSSKQSEDYEFNQSFRIDEDLNSDDIQVSLTSGVLRIQAARKKKTIKKIPVKVMEETSLTSYNSKGKKRIDTIGATNEIVARLEM